MEKNTSNNAYALPIQQKLVRRVADACANARIEAAEEDIFFEHPKDLSHGDYACNIAMRLSKKLGKNPREVAQNIVDELLKEEDEDIQKVEIAGPGFINFTLTDNFFTASLGELVKAGDDFGKNSVLNGKRIMVEYSQPNPFKLLHIGHIMGSTVGEAIARLCAYSGGEIAHANYQGDVGLHVARFMWGFQDLGGYEQIDDLSQKSLTDQVAFLGRSYARGATAGRDNEATAEEIKLLNKKIYEREDEKINAMYDWGRKVSLDYFETQYKRLGINHNEKDGKAFDFYFFESETGVKGKEVVLQGLEKGLFEKSDGAVIFPGEKYGLHTRVFLNALGLPTYEAKEVGLAMTKYELWPYDYTVIETGNEINEYFKVLKKAIDLVYPELEGKVHHVGHGMLRLTTGKMSSRTGDVISAEDMINDVAQAAKEKMDEKGEEELWDQVAVGAIKFEILKGDFRKDVVYDPEKALSFEGDSGPYLQYTHARCCSLLRKAEFSSQDIARPDGWETTELERILYRFPEIVVDATEDYSLHNVATFLIQTARAFNSWYGNTKVIQEGDSEELRNYKLSLVFAVKTVINNGLYILGIAAPERM